MKDIIGKEVSVGDTVVYVVARYSELSIGKVHKVNPKSITVVHNDRKSTRFSNQFVKV